MRDDYSISCTSSKYTFIQIWASVMLLLVPVLTPIVYWFLLAGTHYTWLRKVVDETQLDFLHSTYKDEFWWWETYDSIRRLSLTGITVVILPGSAAQCAFGVILSQVHLKIYTTSRPFIDNEDNVFAELAQYTILATYFAALLLRVDVGTDSATDKAIFGWLLLAVNLLVLVLGVTPPLLEFYATTRNDENSKQDETPSLTYQESVVIDGDEEAVYPDTSSD